MPILSLITFVPLLGMALILLLHMEKHVLEIRVVATAAAAVTFALSVGALLLFPWGSCGMHLE